MQTITSNIKIDVAAEKQLHLYFGMLRIRLVEETIAQLYPEQEMRCPVHLCTGQEAIAVGVCANLNDADYVLSNHRSHGHYLAKGGKLKAMLAEIYGKASGCCQGKGGSMHLVDLSVNYLGSTPIVGGTIPIATGVAFGTLMKKGGMVTVVFLGDAAAEEGVFCESLNFAALRNLPILYVCENNFYSVYSPISVRQSNKRNNLMLAQAFGIYAKKGNGNDVALVDRITGELVEHVRQGKGPALIEFETYRFREHCGPNYDNHIGYRTEKEFLEWRRRCPVENYEKYLIENGVLDQSLINQFKQEILSEIKQAIIFAKESPFPEIAEIYTNVYAEGVKA